MALKSKGGKSDRTLEYLGCDIDFYRKHLESTFLPGMTWENQGKWHIDHVVPIKYEGEGDITLDTVIKRLHWRNTQAMWASDNIAKGNRFIGRA